MKHVYVVLLGVVIILQAMTLSKPTQQQATVVRSTPSNMAMCLNYCKVHGGERSTSGELTSFCHCINPVNDFEFSLDTSALADDYIKYCGGEE